MNTYNQTLFAGGLRTKLHLMRFKWLAQKLALPENSYSLLELGCFDCRTLSYVPKPSHYLGIDAGWQGGLDDARMSFLNRPWMELVMAQSVHDLAAHTHRRFDYSAALEALQFMPDPILRGYLAFLAQVTKKRVFITVPVEIGPVFLGKYIAKMIAPQLDSAEMEGYHFKELVAAVRGQSEKIQRFEHKGFDYRTLCRIIAEFFTITAIEGLPFARHPYSSFQVGIVAEPKIKEIR